MILDYRELAARAAAEIRRRPWVQGDLTDVKPEGWEWHEFAPECGVCLVGGIAAAYYGDPLKMPHIDDDLVRAMWTAPSVISQLVCEIADRVADEPPGVDIVDIVTSWNDAKGRTKDDVLAVLDSIAEGATA